MDWKRFWDQMALSNDNLHQVGRAHEPGTLKKIVEHIRLKLDLKEEDVLLDVCCGNGLISMELAKHCRKVIAVDQSPRLIEKASEEHAAENIEYILGEASQVADLVGEPVDKALLYFSFQYFERYAQGKEVVEALCKATKNGGRILIGDIPDRSRKNRFYDDWRKRFRSRAKRLLGRNEMGRFWTKEELDRITQSLGVRGDFMEEPAGLPYAHYRFDYCIKKSP